MSGLREHIERAERQRDEIPIQLTEMVRRDEIVRFTGDDPVIFMHPLMWVQVDSKTYEERWARILDYINDKIRERALDAELNVIEATEPDHFRARVAFRGIMRDLEVVA